MFKQFMLVLLVLTLLLGSGLLAVAHSDHGHDHDHEEHHQLSARIFAVNFAQNNLVYIDAPDNHVEGVVKLEPFTDVIVNDAGRFIVAVDQTTNRAQIYSTGVFWQAHGDHFDLVANAPVGYWDFVIGNRPRFLSSNDDLVAVVNDRDYSVSVIRPESGVIVTVQAGGHGHPLLTGDYLAVADRHYDLLDIYNIKELTRLAALRIPKDPRGIVASGDLLWLATSAGLKEVDLQLLTHSTLAIDWDTVPRHLIVHPKSLWVYGTNSNSVYALNTNEQMIVEYAIPNAGLLAVDEEDHYVAVLTEAKDKIYMIDIGHGAPRLRNHFHLPQTVAGSVSDMVWVGGYLYVAGNQTIVVLDNQGALADSIELDTAVDKLLVATLSAVEHDHAHGHHDHGHHDHEHHDH